MTPSRRQQTVAALALLIGTVGWGCGFTWAKAAGQAVQSAAGLAPLSPLGPIFLLAWRFLIAAVVWFAIFPASRRGWDRGTIEWGLLVGFLLGAGLIVQHVGLDHTSEAVSAFLTSLTILFVPLLMVVVIRKPPPPALWIGVVIATAGVWIMTGAQRQGLGLGQFLGLSCAFLFSLYILAINAASKSQSPWQMVGAQFAVVAMMCFACCLFLPQGPTNLRPTPMLTILRAPAVWTNLTLLTVFTTLMAFGLLTFFQPLIDPTRAALIYLAEPIFATIYAAIFVHHRPSRLTLIGAGLILVANVVVEFLASRGKAAGEEKVVLVD